MADGSDRALAARALVYLGVCHERLGRAEASAAYRRVIEQFPEQRTAVAEARRRLASLAPAVVRPARTPTLRRTWHSIPPDLHRGGAISADGRTFAYVNRAGHVVLGDLASGTPLRTVATDTTGTVGQRPIPSPQGQIVAYTWQPASGAPVEVRASRTPAAGPRVVYRARPGEAVTVQDWRVPSSLLLEVTTPAGQVSLVLVDAGGTWSRTVAELGTTRLVLSAKHSPDGRFVVYDEPAAGADDRDIVVVPATGGPPSFRLTGPSDDFAPGWASDARLVFVSDKAGSAGLWAVPLRSGRATSPPTLVQRDLGVFINLLGIGTTGALHYNREVGFTGVYVQALDRGRPSGDAWAVGGSHVGGNLSPTFSPDGRSLAFVSQISEAQVASYTRLARCDLETRMVREIATDLTYLVGTPRWSPDGTALLVRAAMRGRYGYHRLEIGTGAATPLATVPYNEDRTLGGARWVDALTFVYQWIPRPDARTRVLRRVSLPGGQQEDWLTFDDLDALTDAVPAPTDPRLALLLVRDGTTTIAIREAEGRLTRILALPTTDQVLSIAWMPDGQALLYTRRNGADRTASLWRVPATGGPPDPLGVQAEGMRDLAVSPDGRHLAWTAGYPRREPWVLEHVLTPR